MFYYSMLQLINNVGHSMEIIRYGSVTVTAFVHLVYLCFSGQLVIDRSTEVFDRA